MLLNGLSSSLCNQRSLLIRVKSVCRIHSCGTAVETERKEDLAAFIGSSNLKEAGLDVSFPVTRNPTLIPYNVPKQMKTEEV